MRSSTPNNPAPPQKRRRHLHLLFELCLFAMLAAMMFCSKIIMEVLPNIHLLGMFTMVLTRTFRVKALIPIYLYVLLNGLYAGFSTWWYPYLYVWTVLWALTMLIPPRLPRGLLRVILPAVCCLHGLAFGVLYAPMQAMMLGFNPEQTVAWIVSGLPFDLLHGIGNLFAGLLILPLSDLLRRLMNRIDQ